MEVIYTITFDSSGLPIKASRFTGNSSFKHLETNEVVVPEDASETYLNYVLVDGVVTEAPISTLVANEKAKKITELASVCQQLIGSGFTSEALGDTHTYPSNLTDQQNLHSAVVASMLTNARFWSVLVWCENSSGVWAKASHTKEQVQQVVLDCNSHVEGLRDKYNNHLQDVEAAATVAAVQAIQWS